uniref:Uncharacterized protein n=1 Tax=Wuchereria bancrofti TaxID=6293 RepID=A0A1I8ECT2_WUCBA
MENESISENLKYSSNRAIVSQKKIKEVRARQKSEAPQNSAYCFRHYSRARQITFINELAVSKSAATNRRRKWFEIHPWPKSPVGEDDSTEYFKRRFGIKNFIVLKDIMEYRLIKRVRKFKLIEKTSSI